MRRPWMKLYVGDMIADTAELSCAEFGAYHLLIYSYWKKGSPLPDDDRKLARICRCTPDEWAEMRPALAEFFTIGRGVWSHKRVEHELSKAGDLSETARSNGRLGAERRTEMILEINGYSQEEIEAAKAKAAEHAEPIRNMRAWLIKVMDNARRDGEGELPKVHLTQAQKDRIARARGEA